MRHRTNVAVAVVGILLETDWHTGYRLEAARLPNGNLVFFKNRLLIGQIMDLSLTHAASQKLGGDTAYLTGMGVSSSARGTGIGRAMIQFVADTTPFQFIALHSAADGFYKQLGFVPMPGSKNKREMMLDTRKFSGSSLKFEEISPEQATDYIKQANAKGYRVRMG